MTYALFINNQDGDNVEYTDELTELEAKMKFIELWPTLAQGWSMIIKRLT
jgi:hypothetical protein